MHDLEEGSCRTCRYFSSDSCRDTLWYVCVHDEVLERFLQTSKPRCGVQRREMASLRG